MVSCFSLPHASNICIPQAALNIRSFFNGSKECSMVSIKRLERVKRPRLKGRGG